jgi:hypothetical protein
MKKIAIVLEYVTVAAIFVTVFALLIVAIPRTPVCEWVSPTCRLPDDQSTVIGIYNFVPVRVCFLRNHWGMGKHAWIEDYEGQAGQNLPAPELWTEVPNER